MARMILIRQSIRLLLEKRTFDESEKDGLVLLALNGAYGSWPT